MLHNPFCFMLRTWKPFWRRIVHIHIKLHKLSKLCVMSMYIFCTCVFQRLRGNVSAGNYMNTRRRRVKKTNGIIDFNPSRNLADSCIARWKFRRTMDQIRSVHCTLLLPPNCSMKTVFRCAIFLKLSGIEKTTRALQLIYKLK